MKRILMTLIMLLSVGLGTAVAQNIIRGRILDERGQGIIGAGVSVKGSPTVGTVTDLDGNFELSAPSGSTLVIQSIGYASAEIAPGGNTTVRLQPSAKELTGAVVTALGVRREKRDLTYSATTVNSDELNQGNQVSALSALQGKTAGVNITSTTGGPGGSTRVVLRGEKSINGGNNALIVVDGIPISNNNRTVGRDGSFLENVDFGNRGNDINPEDIESITVLKGPAAAALYGSLGANGAIMITTKSGRSRTRGGRSKTEVSYNTNLTFHRVLRYPELQTKYGQGNRYQGIADDRRENFSWGDSLDGRLRPWGQVIDGTQQVKPYSAVENNIRDFYRTGKTWENNLSFGGAGDRSAYFLSLNTLNNKGITPNTFYDKYSIRFNGSADLTNNVYTSINVNYLNIHQRVDGQGQGDESIWDNVLQTPVDIPLHEVRNMSSPFYAQNFKDSLGVDRYGYFNNFALNPHWVAENFDNRNRTDRVLGSFTVGYKKGHFNIFNRFGGDIVADRTTIKEPQYDFVPYEDEHVAGLTGYNYTYITGYPAPSTGGYREQNINTTNLYNDLIAQYNAPLSADANVNLLAGFNAQSARTTLLSGDINPENNGLVVPGFYNLTNASGPVVTENELTRSFIMGGYFQARLDWRNAVFLDLTGRNDWTSTLAPGNRSFFYPSVGISWVITETYKDMPFVQNTLNYAKVRASWASVGNGAAAYANNNPAYVRSEITTAFSTVLTPFNNVPGYTYQSFIGNPNLRPERTNASEVGIDLGFFNSRVTLEATYYNNLSVDLITTVPVPSSTGFTSRVVNVGDIRNKGIELAGRIIPIRQPDGLRWELYGTFYRNRNEVLRLNEGTTRISLGGASGAAAYAAVGKPFGAFYTTDVLRNEAGQVVVDSSTGLPKLDPNLVYSGSYQPRFQASWGTTLSYRGLSFNILFDTRQGGVFYSATKDLMDFVGTAKETERRNPYVFPNSVYEGYDGTYKTNNTEFSPYEWYTAVIPAGQHIIDASYVKLREASLSYTLPKRMLERSAFGNLTIGVFGSNLFLWTPSSNKYVDPEVNTGGASNLQGFDFRSRPSTRNFGVRLGVSF